MGDRSLRVLMAGLPETGKTTFLAALWHLLESGELASELAMVEQPTNRKYLNEIRRLWIEGEPVTHTSPNRHETVELRLSVPSGGEFTLMLPDLSGESFRDLWTKRAWHPQLEAFCERLDALALFVHPNAIQLPTRIDQANAVLAAAGVAEEAPPQPAPQKIPPFDPEKSCTATQLAYVLQSLQSKAGKDSTPIVVVVSAWDLIPAGTVPATWVAQNLPLIDQFLRANAPEQPYAVFGVSALGGDIKQAAARDALLAQNDASRRISVTDGGAPSNDISRPIRWLFANTR